MIGEIYIRTPYRSLGYYNQPELTQKAFIPDPFGDDSGEIVYKTGDLARVLEDGNYEFLGRKDQQVKIRGIRVELGEIENLLRGHEGVQDVAVIDRDDANDFKYLCVYVVFEDERETNPAEPQRLSGDVLAGIHAPFVLCADAGTAADDQWQVGSARAAGARPGTM